MYVCDADVSARARSVQLMASSRCLTRVYSPSTVCISDGRLFHTNAYLMREKISGVSDLYFQIIDLILAMKHGYEFLSFLSQLYTCYYTTDY